MKSGFGISDFWTPIYYATKFIGLAPLKLRDKIFYPPSLLDKIYPIALATMYVVMTISKTFLRGTAETDLWGTELLHRINYLYHVISFTTPFCILVTFALMEKKIVPLMNELCIFNNELKNIGIEGNDEKLAKNVFAIALIANIFSVTISVILIFMEAGWNTVICIGHSIQEFIVSNTILIFVSILVCIKQRFALLNEKLFNESKVVRNVGPSRPRRIFVTARAEGKVGSVGFNRICKFKALHLELCDIMNRMACIFEVPILLLSCQFFFVLVVSCYWIYSTFLHLAESPTKKLETVLPYMFCPLLRMLMVIFEMFVIVHASRKTCIQGNSTQNVLHKLWNVIKTTESEYEYLMFSMQLMQNPLAISAFGFFDLDYSYLYKIFGAVLAYVIISIQFDALK